MASIVILGAGLGGMSAAYEFREALGTRVPLTIADDAVSGVQVVVQRP